MFCSLTAPRPTSRRSCRSIWISDVHLGTPRCQAAPLLDFLRHHEAASLYLVGDIIDGWNCGPGWYWDAMHEAVAAEIRAWARDGTYVALIPGNHDADLELAENRLGLKAAPHELVYRTLDGRRLLVTHGHQLDHALAAGRWWQTSPGYAMATRIHQWYGRDWEERAERPRSLSAYLRYRVKRAVEYVTDFDDRDIFETVRSRGLDGIICGHIHRAEQRLIGPIWYINDGDWVESRTALIEGWDGALQLLQWNARFEPETRASETSLVMS